MSKIADASLMNRARYSTSAQVNHTCLVVYHTNYHSVLMSKLVYLGWSFFCCFFIFIFYLLQRKRAGQVEDFVARIPHPEIPEEDLVCL